MAVGGISGLSQTTSYGRRRGDRYFNGNERNLDVPEKSEVGKRVVRGEQVPRIAFGTNQAVVDTLGAANATESSLSREGEFGNAVRAYEQFSQPVSKKKVKIWG